jgi:hypothetical protein
MFKLAINKDGEPVVLTDNITIADQIRKEGTQPVYFTASPTRLTAESLANGLFDVFGGTVTGAPEYRSLQDCYVLRITFHASKEKL